MVQAATYVLPVLLMANRAALVPSSSVFPPRWVPISNCRFTVGGKSDDLKEKELHIISHSILQIILTNRLVIYRYNYKNKPTIYSVLVAFTHIKSAFKGDQNFKYKIAIDHLNG